MIHLSAKRRIARILASTAVAVGVAGSAGACVLPSNGGVKTSADNTHSAKTAATASAKAAKVGDSITLTGETAGDKLSVTLVKIVSSGVRATDGFSSPDAGKHYVAVQFRLTNSGTGSYSDDPYLDVQVLDAAGQSYQPDYTLTASSAGQGLASSIEIAPGDSQLGYVVVQMPDGDKPATIQYSLDAGLGATAQWRAS